MIMNILNVHFIFIISNPRKNLKKENFVVDNAPSKLEKEIQSSLMSQVG